MIRYCVRYVIYTGFVREAEFTSVIGRCLFILSIESFAEILEEWEAQAAPEPESLTHIQEGEIL